MVTKPRFDPRSRLNMISDINEKKVILGLLDIIENIFGFDFIVANNTVVEIRMIATGLVSVPRALGDLPNLYKLQLPSNKIRKLRNLERCINLQTLNLSSNEIESNELKSLNTLQKLKALDLSNNKINSLAPFQELKQLESLTLNENKIVSIPPLPQLNHLKFLELSNNPIEKLRNIQYLESILSLKIDQSILTQEEKIVLTRPIEQIKEYCRRIDTTEKAT